MKAKSVTVLVSGFALLIGLMAVAAPASAQVAFTVSSLPQQARFEGLTETMGAVQATNNGTPGVVKAGSSITVLYTATIVAPATAQNVLTCSVGVTGTGTVCAVGAPSVTIGSVSGGQLTISFAADTTFATGSYVLVSQVRVNVNGLGAAATAVTATLSGTSAVPQTFPLTFTNATVPVAAIVNPSLTVTVTAAAAPMQTCAVGVTVFSIAVAERYPAALTTTANETAFTGGATGTYVTSNGTSVVVTFTGLPSGLAIFSTGAVGGALGATGSPVVQTSTGPTSTLTFIFPTLGGTTNAIDTSTLTFSAGVSNATATAVGAGALTAIGSTATITASVNIGPVQAAASGPVSFATNTQPNGGTVATIGDCVTNLLFPFMTNEVGFDTTFTITNTTSDDLAFGSGAGAAAQSGTCNLVMYPTTLATQTSSAAGTLSAASNFTTPTIGAGGTYVFLQSATQFAGRSGYLFAICRFLDAHGFSFVTNGPSSTATISQGLLALVIQNTATRLPFVNFEALGN